MQEVKFEKKISFIGLQLFFLLIEFICLKKSHQIESASLIYFYTNFNEPNIFIKNKIEKNIK
jgi:hypothetical protein